MKKMLKIIKEEITNFINEYDEEFFQTKLPKERKKHLHRYVGRGVTWYGNPDQMIVVHKDQIHGMWGNVYDQEKLEYVENMIRNSEENVEFECSYALGDVIDVINIIEHQRSAQSDRFNIDFDGHEKPYSIGDDTLDEYLGKRDIDDIEFIRNTVSNSDIFKFFEKYKMELANNNVTEEELLSEYQKFDPDESEMYAFNDFVEIEKYLGEAFRNEDGDLGKFVVQLRDAHHRVMGAINAGEQYVCVNLEREDLITFADYIKRV